MPLSELALKYTIKWACGFLEAVYQECLEIEFKTRKIPFAARKELLLCYRESELKQRYIADFICYDPGHSGNQGPEQIAR